MPERRAAGAARRRGRGARAPALPRRRLGRPGWALGAVLWAGEPGPRDPVRACGHRRADAARLRPRRLRDDGARDAPGGRRFSPSRRPIRPSRSPARSSTPPRTASSWARASLCTSPERRRDEPAPRRLRGLRPAARVHPRPVGPDRDRAARPLDQQGGRLPLAGRAPHDPARRLAHALRARAPPRPPADDRRAIYEPSRSRSPSRASRRRRCTAGFRTSPRSSSSSGC